jgi:hypothetical protein
MIDPVGVSRRAVRRRLRETSCPDCEHPWEEHGSSTDERPTACGECQYEEDHAQQDPGREKCWNIVPDALFVLSTARKRERAAPLQRKFLLRSGQVVMAVLRQLVRRPDRRRR